MLQSIPISVACNWVDRTFVVVTMLKNGGGLVAGHRDPPLGQQPTLTTGRRRPCGSHVPLPLISLQLACGNT